MKKSILFIIILIFVYNSSVFASYTDDNVYINKKYGYSFNRCGFKVDDKFETIKTTFIADSTYVDVFYNDFNNTIHSTNDYVYYSNKEFKNNEYIDIKLDKKIKFGEYSARVIKWDRKPLKHVKFDNKDFTHYALIDIIKNREVYTIQINSVYDVDYDEYLNRFNFVKKDNRDRLKYGEVHRIENKYWSDKTKQFYKDEFQSIEKTKLGIFEPSTVSSTGLDKLKGIENEHNLKFDYILEYYSLPNIFIKEHFDEIYADGRILEFTFQTSDIYNENDYIMYEILDGKYDNKIDELAKFLNKLDGVVFFRLDNEMNGDWCDYNAIHFNRDTRLYKEMWKYFYDRIVSFGGENIIFVFNPNEKSFPDFKWNHYINYFPSNKYVDVIGATGYNTGTYYRGEVWRSFKDIYDKFMPYYKKRFIGYDFYITEFASSTIGGDRAKWLDEMLQCINEYGFKVAIYWNYVDYDYINKKPARIYRIDDDIKAMEIIEGY